MSYLSLFLSAFIAATLLPFYSEVVLAGLIVAGEDPLWLWVVATLGNTLGAVVNWFLGDKLLHFQDKKWFPFKEAKLAKAQYWFNRYGLYSLLFAWLPIIGDPLTFVAGVLKTRFLPFVVLVAIGKGLRYFVIITLVMMNYQ